MENIDSDKGLKNFLEGTHTGFKMKKDRKVTCASLNAPFSAVL